jgi:hypothetical protein
MWKMRPRERSVLRDEPGGGPVSRFACSAGRGLAALEVDDLREGNLSLVFSLSAWLRTSGAGIGEALSALLDLRSALLEVAALDRASEPIPLIAGEPRTALLSLATYLHGLIVRAARISGAGSEAVVERALLTGGLRGGLSHQAEGLLVN